MDVTIQEDSEKTGKVTSAGMYFLHFQVYRMDSTLNAVSQFLHFFFFFCSSFLFPWLHILHFLMTQELVIYPHACGADCNR